MACSPGGRFLRSSLIFTPPLLSLSIAVPTLWPLASFNSTVMGLFAAFRVAAMSPAAATIIILAIIFALPPRIFARFGPVRQRHTVNAAHQCQRLLQYGILGYPQNLLVSRGFVSNSHYDNSAISYAPHLRGSYFGLVRELCLEPAI